jgi:hypothetical protein
MAVKTFTDNTSLPASDINAYLANSGLVYITSGALSSTATNFAGCFTSTFNNYRVVIDGLNVSSAADIYIRFLNGTTPNATATYQWAYTGLRIDNIGADTAAVNNTKGYTGMSATVGAEILASCSLDVYGPQQTQRTWIAGVAVGYETNYYSRSGMAFFNNTNSFDGFQVLTATAATFTGNVTVYGYRKA